MKVIIVSTHSRQSVGDGGTHRTYQIWHDLEVTAGLENVIGVQVPPWWKPAPAVPSEPLRPWLARGVRRARRMADRLMRPPAAVLAASPPSLYTATPYLPASFLQGYAVLVASLDQPAVCVIEHSGFAAVMPINARHGLATWICAQNLEALETAFEDQDGRGDWQRLASDLAHELRVLEQCSERLFISKVEAGFVGGLGLVSHYYPYRPVGEIRDRLLGIRQIRTTSAAEPGLFLMLGSASHVTTGASMRWLIEQMQQNGLPPGTRVVIAGNGTERLLPAGQTVAGLELRGWVAQDELDQLFTRAQAALIPQHLGFGALTRLSEFACAGIPTIVSRPATYAIDIPPGAIAVADRWTAWQAALDEVQRPPRLSSDEYEAWESRQPCPLPVMFEGWPKP